MRFREQLATTLADIVTLSDSQLDQIDGHYETLVRWNEKLNLVRFADVRELVVRHYSESVFLGQHLPDGARTVVDVGSGAGFPGVPVAVLLPNVSVTLIEANQRKAVFLREASRAIANVTVMAVPAVRADSAYDILVGRAITWSDIVVLLPRLCDRVAVLVGERPPEWRCVTWTEALKLPWGERRWLHLGDVSRETDQRERST